MVSRMMVTILLSWTVRRFSSGSNTLVWTCWINWVTSQGPLATQFRVQACLLWIEDLQHTITSSSSMLIMPVSVAPWVWWSIPVTMFPTVWKEGVKRSSSKSCLIGGQPRQDPVPNTWTSTCWSHRWGRIGTSRCPREYCYHRCAEDRSRLATFASVFVCSFACLFERVCVRTLTQGGQSPCDFPQKRETGVSKWGKHCFRPVLSTLCCLLLCYQEPILWTYTVLWREDRSSVKDQTAPFHNGSEVLITMLVRIQTTSNCKQGWSDDSRNLTSLGMSLPSQTMLEDGSFPRTAFSWLSGWPRNLSLYVRHSHHWLLHAWWGWLVCGSSEAGSGERLLMFLL